MQNVDASQITSIRNREAVEPTLRPLVNAAAVAEMLGVTPARAYELARCNTIPCVRVGRQVRFDMDKVRAWIEDGGRALPGGWRREREGDK